MYERKHEQTTENQLSFSYMYGNTSKWNKNMIFVKQKKNVLAKCYKREAEYVNE